MTDARGPVPAVDLRDGVAIPHLGFGTLNVQPDRESTQLIRVEEAALSTGLGDRYASYCAGQLPAGPARLVARSQPRALGTVRV